MTVPNTTGLYYIYFASGAYTYQTSFFDLENQVPTSYVYWNSSTGKAEYFADERHGMVLDWQTHEYLHRTRGASLASGFVLGNYTVAGTGSADADAQVGLTDGTFYDEDIQVDILNSLSPTPDTWEQVIAPVGEFPVAYMTGSGDWVLDAPTQFPMKQGTSRVAYNLYSGGAWTTPDLGNNKYGISWLVATNNLNYPVFAILGQAEYTSETHATSALWENLSLGGFPSLEFRPLYKLIYATSTSYSNTPHAKLVAVEDIRSMARVGAGTAVSDHGGLTGLADDDHVQYALADGTRGSFDAAGAAASVQTNLTTHEGLTTTAHGGIVSSTDSRLTDARTPTSHAASHGAAGSDPVTVASSQVTGLGGAAALNVGTTAGTVAAGDDSRLSDARTPTAHAASHQDGGSDELALAGSQITTGTVDAARVGQHGMIQPFVTSGSLILGLGTTVSSTNSFAPNPTSGNAYGTPLPVGVGRVVNSVVINLTTLGAAGESIRVGLYASDTSGLPTGAPLYDAAYTVGTGSATTGYKYLSLASPYTTVGPIMWLFVASTSASQTARLSGYTNNSAGAWWLPAGPVPTTPERQRACLITGCAAGFPTNPSYTFNTNWQYQPWWGVS